MLDTLLLFFHNSILFLSTSYMMDALHSMIALLMTTICYYFARYLFNASHYQPWLNPILSAAILVSLVLITTDTAVSRYSTETQLMDLLLVTATIALAVPLSAEIIQIKHQWRHWLLLLCVILSLATSTALLLSHLVGADLSLLLAMISKSITTPITLSIADVTQAQKELCAFIVITTGIVGAVIAPPFYKWLNLTDERYQGFCLGIIAHAVGTARAFQISATAGAFAALGMSLSGIIALALAVLFSVFS